MAKKKNKRKQTIRIFFRDGKKDVIPQKLWDDYEIIAKDSGVHLARMSNGSLDTI